MELSTAGRRGIVTDIQRCSTHDGPGIRTTVFLKGCNMRCAWCHNPETISRQPEWLLYPEKCIGCGECESGCFSGARVLCGRDMDATSVMREVMLDRPYYGTDGGLTVSGGEPLCQPEFTKALLAEARAAGVGTAVETNLSLPWSVVETVLPYCDLVMADLKLWDDASHVEWTGVSNASVKANLRRLSGSGLPFVVRTPVVPGVNATARDVSQIALFLSNLPGLLYYELLPYHPLGTAKRPEGAERDAEFERPSASLMDALAHAAGECGVLVKVAGKRPN